MAPSHTLCVQTPPPPSYNNLWRVFSLEVACLDPLILVVINVGDYQPHLLITILMGY